MRSKNYKLNLILLIIILSGIFNTGCADFIKTPMELVQKPRLEKEQELIADVINHHIPANAYLARPIVSNNLSSANFIDIDNDGVDEVYAFYVDKINMNVGIVFLKQVDSNWKLFSVIGNVGKDIAYSRFDDIDGDGNLEIIIGTTSRDQNFKSLFIYKIYDENYEMIYKDMYSELLIADLDEDGLNEMLIFKLDRENFADVQLVKHTNHSLNIVDKITMDAYINGYYNIVYGNINEDEKAVVFDFKIGTKSATNMLFFDKNKLRLAFDSFENNEIYRKTLKENPIKSKDYDNDGFIEIGSSFVSHVHTENSKIVPDIVNWLKYKDGKFSDYKLMYYSKKGNVEMKFPRYISGLVYSGKIVVVDSKSYLGDNIVSLYYKEDTSIFKILEINRYSIEKYSEIYRKIAARGIIEETLKNALFEEFGYELSKKNNFIYFIKYMDIRECSEKFKYDDNFINKLLEIKKSKKSIINSIKIN